MKSRSRFGVEKILLGAAAFSLAALSASTARASTFGILWEEAGYPYDAAKIAACNPTEVWAFNTDHSLWVNNSGGVDSGWRYITSPGSAASIGCDGRTLIVMNADKTLWHLVLNSSGGFDYWQEYNTLGATLTIGGGPGILTAINTNQSLYTSTANDTTEFSGAVWWGRGVAGDAARFTGFQAWSGYNPWGLPDNVSRFFALNYDGSLWLNEGVVLENPGTWRLIEAAKAGPALTEIAAAGPTDIYGLDSSRHLWHGYMPPLVSQVTYVFSGSSPEQNDYVKGTITVNADGSWWLNNAYLQMTVTSFGSTGFDITCSLPDLTLNWSGQVGGNIVNPPTENLDGNGTTVGIANDWYNVMSNAECNPPSNGYICGTFSCDVQTGG
jgi:hypothetical protein